jgi:hypothetical protein
MKCSFFSDKCVSMVVTPYSTLMFWSVISCVMIMPGDLMSANQDQMGPKNGNGGISCLSVFVSIYAHHHLSTPPPPTIKPAHEALIDIY